MAMFSAYLDESGHPDTGEYLVVSGCVAEIQQWVELEREWRAALVPFGATIFHRVDFENKRAPFDAFANRSEANKFLSGLIEILCKHVEKTFSVAVPLSRYRAINEHVLLAEWHGYPYPLASSLCMAYIEEWRESRSIEDRVECVFEDGAKHKGQLLWLAEKDKLDIPIFKTKDECLPIQTADLIAWEHHRILNDEVSRGTREYSSSFELLERVPHQWEVLKLDNPAWLIEQGQIPNRDPNMSYTCKIIKRGGKRRALIHRMPLKQKRAAERYRTTVSVPNEPS